MGMTEEIQELNTRIAALNKNQDTAKKLLAVEEHKLGEITTSLSEEGYDVSTMSETDITNLVAQLTEKFHSTKETIESKLAEAEKLYSKLEEINQKG